VLDGGLTLLSLDPNMSRNYDPSDIATTIEAYFYYMGHNKDLAM
jgi:hypothetical protein